jgi:hypothetical protein
MSHFVQISKEIHVACQDSTVPVTPMTMDDGDDDKELEEIEVLAELAEIMGPGTEASTNGAKSSM